MPISRLRPDVWDCRNKLSQFPLRRHGCHEIQLSALGDIGNAELFRFWNARFSSLVLQRTSKQIANSAPAMMGDEVKQKVEETESVRNIRKEAIGLQISIGGSYILLARNSKDPLQARVFKDKADAACAEAMTLLHLAPLEERDHADLAGQLRIVQDSLSELDAILSVSKTAVEEAPP